MTTFPLQRDEVAGYLREHGITPTRPRVEIGTVLFQGHQHLSADQVQARLTSHVSKASVYNTLSLFTERGLLRQLIVDPTRVLYDTNVAPHHHYYDVERGELLDMDSSDALQMSPPAPPHGMAIESVDIIVRVRRDSATH